MDVGGIAQCVVGFPRHQSFVHGRIRKVRYLLDPLSIEFVDP